MSTSPTIEDYAVLDDLIGVDLLRPLRSVVPHLDENNILVCCDEDLRGYDPAFQTHLLSIPGGGVMACPSHNFLGERDDLDDFLVCMLKSIVRVRRAKGIVLTAHYPCLFTDAADMPLVAVIDALIRGATSVTEKFPKIKVTCLLRVVNDGRELYTTEVVFASIDAWCRFYDKYEMEALGRVDAEDGDDLPASAPIMNGVETTT